mgnify:FL=1
MKNLKKVLALVLAVVMIMGTIAVASAKDYSDVKATDNYAEAIDILSNLKILDGFEDGTFKAEGTLTRAQAAKIVAIVHNAATNGKIQSDIADLYANAQNPFVDCNGNWALPYINYCRITGLADGMTATTYAPKREVTGVQFLKLMLTTLNFNTSKEGYTGTGWDINVLNRANEIGLTAGLADGWKAIAPVKRGEAAQILVNALTAYLVEYGTKIKAPSTIDYSPIAETKATNAYKTAYKAAYDKAYDAKYAAIKDSRLMTDDEKVAAAMEAAEEAGIAAGKKAYDDVWAKFGVNGLFDVAFVSKETVNKTGMTLASKMGITVKADNDKFMRPGTRWTYKSWSKFYMDTAKATYNTAVTVCDVLKAFGVAESDSTAITANVYTDGIKGLSNEDSFNAQSHKNTARSCKKDTIGCQGVLTQVWKVGTEYRITEIHYFLAQVETVNKATHNKDVNSDIRVYFSVNNGNVVTPHNHRELSYEEFNIDTADYAKDTWLVVTVSRIGNKAGYEDLYKEGNGSEVVDHAAAEIKTGKLTGAAVNVDPSITKIDGTSYKDACQFVKGYDITKADTIWTAPSKNGNTYDFAMDPFGNVIGCIEHTDSKTYVVIDKIWDANAEATGDMLNAAVLVGFDAKPTDKIFVDKLTDWVKAYDDASLNSLLMTAAQKNTRWAGEIFTYTVNKDGNYVLTYTADKFENDAFVSYKKGEAWVDYDVNGSSYGVKINNATKFLVKDVTGEYKAYTGYAGLPALTGSTIDFVVDDNNYAEYVYITGAAYASDKVTGFVINNGAWDNEWVDTKTGINYELKTVYVNGEATTVRLSLAHGDEAEINETGFYTFKTEVDENGVMIYKVDDFRSVGELYTVKSFDKGVLETTDGHAVVLDEIPVYLVEMAGLTVGTTDDLTEKDGRKIYMHYELEKGEYVLKAIYVMLDGIVPDVH